MPGPAAGDNLFHRHPGVRGALPHRGGRPAGAGGNCAQGQNPHHPAAGQAVPQAVEIRSEKQNRLQGYLSRQKRYAAEPPPASSGSLKGSSSGSKAATGAETAAGADAGATGAEPGVGEAAGPRQLANQSHFKSLGHIVTLSKNNNTKLLIQTAAKELTAMNELIAVVRGEMTRLAKELPEYETVHSMYGVGDTTAAQLIAEIGDIRNFPRRSSLVGFAGVDPAVDDSGKNVGNSKSTTKCGSPHLRKTLFQIMTIYLRLAPQDEPVYQFLNSAPRASRTMST